MIQINPLKSYIDGGVRAALTTPPSASLVFDLPGKAIWVKGVKLKGTDHTYTFSHDNYITLTNTPDSNESEDIKIGVNTSVLKSAIDTTYGVVSTTANGLAPKFTSGNKQAAAAATTYYFLGWAGSTLKWYQAPFRNIRINSETTDCLGVNNTNPLIIGSGNGISVTWDSTNKKIIITNTKPDVNHNTDTKVAQSVTTQNKNYAIILKGNDSDEGSITTVNFSTYLKFNPSTKQLTINGNKVITTIDTFVGATTSADGSVGLVTKPLIANRLQFLRGDGTWATPIDTWRPVKVEGTEKLGSNALDLSAGNGISIIYNSDTKKIIITNTKPDVNHNTHYTTMLYIGENNDTKANKNVANPYLKLFDDNTRRATFQIKAGSGIAVASDANGNITITNSSPDINHNTDRTGIKLTTVSGTKKTDSTLILANSTTGLNIQGGTNKFLIGDGTNYIEVPVTPSFTISNKDAIIGTTLTTIATIAGVDIKAKIASYSLSNHTHSVTINGSTKTIAASGAVDLGNYLPLSGGTMGGTAWIVWPDSGNWGNGNSGVTFPVTRGGLHWLGQSDWVKLFSEETSNDNLNLILQFGDDNSNGLSIRNASNVQTSHISAGGVITTKTFKGNLDWSYITNKPSSYTPSAHTHTVFNNNLMIKGTNGISDSASIHLGIGDSDTGFKWISDGKCQIYANNSAVGEWTSGGMNWFKNPTVNGNKIWNAGNDGSGSGLDADTVDGEHASNFSYTHQTSFDFSKSKSGRIVTFDQQDTDYGWINGFASTYNNYLTSVLFNTHRTSNWYVGYIEGDISTGKTNGLQAVHKLAFIDQIPTSLKNPHALTISLNGTSQGAYDGSAAKSINITPSSIGASSSSHTHAYLPLSGGTMTGNITYKGKGTSYIGNGENDAANGVGGALNNLVISSWYGISFTTSCSGQTYTNKNAVSINCRNGYVYANTFVGTFSGNASTATKLTSSAGNAALPIYFSDGKPVACTASLIFSNLSNNGNNLSITVAGQNRLLTVAYASTTSKLISRGSLAAYEEGSTTKGESGLNLYTVYNNGYPVKYGNLLHINDSGAGQLLAEWCGSTTLGHLYYRSKRDNSDNGWSAWGKVAFVTDNVATASKWITARKITLSGSVTGSVSIDGSGDVTLATTTHHTHNWENIEGKPSTFTPSAHTHNYITISTCSSLDGNSSNFSVEYAGGNNSVTTKPSGVDAFGVMRLRTAAGWYGQILMSANTAPGIYYRSANGLTSSVNWIKLLDSNNSSVSGGGNAWGSSITININGISKTLTIPNNPNTDITVKQTPKTDNINRPIMMINGSTSTGEQINTSMFSTSIYANASTKMITANGFIKAGSSNNYVLLGGGNHKAISEFSMAHTHPYLPLAGGTMTGVITAKAYMFEDAYNGALNMANSNIYGLNSIYTADLSNEQAEGMHFYRTSTTVDTFRISNGVMYFVPNRTLGSTATEYTVIHSGNYNSYAPSKTGTGASGTWGISITGNSATATKLQTARTIWGQNFDGTADVDNTLRIRQTTGNYCEGIRIQTADSTWATIILGATGDSGTNANAWSIHRKADNNFSISRNSADGLNGLVMTSVGMGLGTTAPAYRLHVNGDIYTTTGFKKNGSSDSYVLLGGGGHKLISDFATSGHNHFTRLDGTNIDTGLSNTNNWHYEIYNATGTLPFTEIWRQVYVMGGADANYTTQISTGLTSNTALYFRHRRAGSWDAWRTIIDSVNYTAFCATSDHNHNEKYLRKDTNDSTPYQYTFTKTNDHAIRVGTVRGTAVGSQTGEYIHLYERVAIGSPSGWGSRPAPSYGLATYGGAWLATDTGSVGIGTTSPSYKLHVSGDSYTSDWSRAGSGFYCQSYGTHYYGNANKDAVIYTGSQNVINFETTVTSGRFWINYRAPISGHSAVNQFHFGASTGGGYGTLYALHYYESSDIRYKHNITTLNITSEKLSTLPLFNFVWDQTKGLSGWHTGTSAQEVVKILPNIISGDDSFLTLDYGVLGTIAGITACKELVIQKSELQQLKEKVKQLEDKLRKYENTL